MDNKTNRPSLYSLSMEELSLALGMINRPDMSQALIRSIYPDITDHQMEARFISATNSLLAFNLMTLTDKNIPQLGKELEMLVFPLAFYDQMLQLTLSTKHNTQRTSVHIQRGKRFISHSTEKGIIHKLEQGVIAELQQYLTSYFNGFPKGTKKAEYGKVPQSLLNQSKEGKETPETILVQRGWSKSAAREFSEDLASPILRGTIVRVDANSQMTGEETLKAPKHALALLQGKKNSWLMDFPADSPDLGNTQQVNEQGFQESLAHLLS